MIRLSTPKEIRARVDAIYRVHVKAWAARNPVPDLPSVDVVIEEIAGGKTQPIIKGLEEALCWSDNGDKPSFGYAEVFDCISTPSIDCIRFELKERELRRVKFMTELDQARDELLDRVLFDHDAPYPLIQSFRNWKDSTQRSAEPFDGK